MTRASLLLAALAAALSFAPAQAQPAEGAFYRAELAAPVAAQTVVAGGIAWRCDGSVCSAGKNNSRDPIVCARLAREVGALTSFASRKGALEAEDLARCNQAA